VLYYKDLRALYARARLRYIFLKRASCKSVFLKSEMTKRVASRSGL